MKKSCSYFRLTVNSIYILLLSHIYICLRHYLFFFRYSFILENVDDRMAGKYRCIGKNRLGTIQNEFQLLIRGI